MNDYLIMAFLEVLKIDSKVDCFRFHDLDFISEDDRIMYQCPQNHVIWVVHLINLIKYGGIILAICILKN